MVPEFKDFDEFLESDELKEFIDLYEAADFDKYSFDPEAAMDRLYKRQDNDLNRLEYLKTQDDKKEDIELQHLKIRLDEIDIRRQKLKNRIYYQMKKMKSLKRDKVKKGAQKAVYIEKARRQR